VRRTVPAGGRDGNWTFCPMVKQRASRHSLPTRCPRNGTAHRLKEVDFLRRRAQHTPRKPLNNSFHVRLAALPRASHAEHLKAWVRGALMDDQQTSTQRDPSMSSAYQAHPETTDNRPAADRAKVAP